MMKQSKQIPLLHLLLLLMATGLGLTACSEDDFAGGEGIDEQRFSVSVTDGGYSSANGGLQTRAIEKGYATEFTANDQIGIFAVKDGAIRSEVNNLYLTASIEGGSLVWKDASGNTPLKFSGATYYAYYPYQAILTGTLDASANDAAGFFAGVISSWAPSTNQGTYAKYTAQDLMVAKGSIGSNGLSFTMQHQMALAVIQLPGTKYEFNNTNPSLSDYVIDPANTYFDNYNPYRMTDGTYRYLVNPNSSTSALTGGYTNASGTDKGWEIDPTSISSGSYKLYRVGGGIVTVVADYTLQIGDYMLNDGTLVGKDETLAPTQKANCMGIVFWVGDDAKDGTHGKIVSLDEQSGRWGVAGKDESLDVAGIRDENNGHTATKNLIAARKDDPDFSTNYSAFNWIYQIKNKGDASGIWYLPAENELSALRTAYNDYGRFAFNDKLTAVAGIGLSDDFYWSSSESRDYVAMYVDFRNNNVAGNVKDVQRRVRAVSVF